jgi:hypothetical protein
MGYNGAAFQFIVNSSEENAMEKIVANPYQVGGMIRNSERFFGRKRETREILSRVATMQNVSVVGERRIGKSSLLQHLTRTGKEKLGDDYATHDFYYLNLQQPIESSEEFYDHACKLINGQQPPQFDAAATTTLDKDDLERLIAGRRIILCLDEFEQTIEADFGSDFFKALRHLAQSGNLALIVATQSPLSNLYLQYEDLTSGFPNIFNQLQIGELAEDEAREMVTTPRNSHHFDENESRRILEIAGNHPYWLSYACAEAYDAKQFGTINFDQIKKRLEKERAMAQATQTVESEEEELIITQSKQRVASWPPANDPNAPVRLALILALLGLAVGSSSANAHFPFGMYVSFALLAASLLLMLFKGFNWRGGTQ